MDQDDDGSVSYKEWMRGLAKNEALLAKAFGGATLKEVGAAFKRLDQDRDMKLTWGEFVAGLKAHLADRDALLETGVLVASLVVAWEGAEVCGHQDTDFGSCKTWGQDYTNVPCTKRLAWGIACGVISAVVTLLWKIPRVAAHDFLQVSALIRGEGNIK